MELTTVVVDVRHAAVLERLMQLYMYDMTAYIPFPLDAEGRYRYPNLEAYCQHPDHHGFLLQVDGEWAGLAMIQREDAETGGCWSMAEFGILRKFWRKGIAKTWAPQLIQQFPGPWVLRVLENNVSAKQAWENILTGFVFSGSSVPWKHYPRPQPPHSFEVRFSVDETLTP